MIRLVSFAWVLACTTARAEPAFVNATIAGASTGHSFGVAIDTWIVERVSMISQLDYVDTPGDGFLSFRFTGGVGAAFSRPQLRAGVHAGFGLEIAPMDTAPDEDHAGVTAFVEARVLTTPASLYLLGTTRATYYRDLDCSEHPERTRFGESDQPSCSTFASDFTPHVGWEAEIRLGSTRAGGGEVNGRANGGFIGARYAAVVTDERVEHHALALLGWAMW